MPVVPFIPLIAAGVGGGLGLLGAKKASDAQKAQQAKIDPLIQQQADTSKWALDQAKIDIPNARNTLQGPLNFWNTILSGDRNAAMSVAGPTADQLAGQTAAANRSQAEFSPRGGRRTLMLGSQPLETTTSLNQGLLALRPAAADKATTIGQILAQLGLGETSASAGAGSSAISGQNNANEIALNANAQTAAAYKGVGASIGNGLLALQKMLENKTGDGGFGTSAGTDSPLQIRMYNPEHPTWG